MESKVVNAVEQIKSLDIIFSAHTIAARRGTTVRAARYHIQRWRREELIVAAGLTGLLHRPGQIWRLR
jgi:hypothetical protein